MKTYLLVIGLLVALLGVIVWQYTTIKDVKEERDAYRGNTQTLMGDLVRYQTKDSLNAVTVGELSLRLAELRQYREKDFDLINSLHTKNRDLQGLTTTQLETIYRLRGSVRDSIVYVDNIITDTLRCLTIRDKWFDLDGCVDRNREFTGQFVNRDSLIYIETIQYKRFLGFLWKTKRVKDRKQDIVSKNPNTDIIGAEFITIRN